MRLKVAGVWLSTRLFTLVVAFLGSAGVVAAGGITAYADVWRQWDTRWFESIAVFGYVGPYVSELEDFHYNIAFFPGFPAMLELGQHLGLNLTLVGMAVSLIAGLFAAWALAQIAKDLGADPIWTVVAWTVAPTALFLTAAYTEALFAAFAFWAWAVARRHSWVLAGLLGACAALVRSNGLFLCVGLIVMFLTSRPWRAPNPLKDWLRGSALLLPAIATFGYFAYLHSLTGSWHAWSDAQRIFWKRELVDPITSLVNTYHLVFTFSPTGEPSSRFVTELIAMAILLATVVVLAVKRWWAEFAYSTATAIALGTSSMYYSIPRTLVLIFPLWILLGLWLTRHRVLRWVYLIGCLAALALVTVRFTQAQWIS